LGLKHVVLIVKANVNKDTNSCITDGELYVYKAEHVYKCIVMDLINALPGNSSVNTVQHATIEEAVFSVDPTDAPIDWLDNDHVICVYCSSMSVLRLYK
jgi:hypothetical protein